jgi:hypothetical protein
METDFYGEDGMHVHLAVTRCHIAQILSDLGDQEVSLSAPQCVNCG